MWIECACPMLAFGLPYLNFPFDVLDKASISASLVGLSNSKPSEISVSSSEACLGFYICDILVYDLF